ncbi:MBL fold metallo-hydrolase [Rhizobium rhizosphaerae]|uniref:MBL fold metallo-hydrolase n=1 Tax=Xaviernesmea rhizosphaerae TaxID=1672749 RepID=A0ABX3PGK2_9HYPH|nr:MBL fold metallo-hydrolase [Xaviernesmea rhizosphaerae]OQP87232.1 MBL fold metallo-hydrolase [Xaviernesmea rhizosphaerae]
MSTPAPPVIELATYPGLDPRIVLLRAGEEVDAAFVRTQRFDLLIDTLSTPDDCRTALALLGSRFPDLGTRPLTIVNSHMDWDHFWGNAALAGRGPIIAHAAARARLAAPAARETLAQKQAEDPRFAGVTLVAPDITFDGGLQLDGGDLTIELIHTPGHTPDHLAVWIPEIRTCLAVDAVEMPIPEVWSRTPEDLHQLRASLARIQALDAAFVVTAHGRSCDPALVAGNIAYFDALEQRVAALATTAEAPAGHDLSGDGEALPLSPEGTGLRLEDLVSLPSGMDADTRAFYEGFHATNLAATLAARRQAPGAA